MTESFCLRSPRLQRHLASAAYFVCCFAILSPDVLAQFRLREPSTQSSDNEAPTTATPRLTAPIVRKPSAMNNVNRDLDSEVRHDTEGEGKVADDSEPREESDLPDEETVLPSVRTMRLPPSMERSLKRPSSDAGSGTSRPMESEPVELIDADPEPSDFAAGPVPRTRGILEEAALRDAGLVGQFACAAGDRGVICTSRDGGLSWTTSALELDCQLMSVCFLTDQVGWIGGWIRDSQSSDRQSLIVATRDGGVSWTRLIGPPVLPGSSTLTASSLPPIIHLEYFGLDEAVVVTMSSERHGSKRIFQSRDGGLTWSAINADEASEEWLGADFISPSEGIIGGERECYATVVANQAVVINSPQPTLRGMRGASLDSSGSGWLVGDGGNLVVTDNAGVTWRTPDGRRPEEFSRLADLRTVTHHDKIVIAAGSPGSFVLRSEDAGNTWDVIPTTARGLLHRIRLNSQGLAIAVGTFGQILRSTDSGFTWETVRSEQRRTGLLNLAGNSLDISWNLMARVAAEDGIRSAVVQMSQPFDAGISSISQRWHPRAAERLAALGICDGASDWMFARTRPEAHRSAMMLVSEWDRQTDGQLRELLPLRLARQLRIWQPSVVVVEPCPMQGSGDDAVASILRDALPRAIQMAADEHHPGLGRLHLPAWTVARVVTRTQRDGTSSLKYSETDLLPRLRTTTGLLVDFAKGAEAVDRSSRLLSSSDSFYTIAFDQTSQTSAKHLFDGITETLDASCRRAIPSLDRDRSKQLQEVVTSARIEASSLTGTMDLVGGDGTLIAQLESVGQSLPATLALRQLRELGHVNLQQDNMEGYLAVQQEIIRRFPDEQDAQQAAEELLLFYSSAETRRYRMQGQLSASATSKSEPGDSTVGPQMTGPFQSNATNHLDALQQRWDEHAATAFRILTKSSGRSSSNTPLGTNVAGPRPDILLRQAVNCRNQSLSSEHSTLLSEVSRMSEPFGTFARVEMQITHGASVPEIPVFNVPRRKDPPFLDGKLSDSIWESADEIRLLDRSPSDLTSASAETPLSSLVMLGSDENHLFVAGVFHFPEQATRRITLANHRTHDADHEEKDRFELEIDTDRDYSTSFQFTIDESGLTSERCWMLNRWNPTWYVDVKRDENSWRFEAAIPLRELVNQQPRLGTVWGIRLRRIQPGQHRHELMPDKGPATNGTGLIRFIRPRVTTAANR